MSFSKGDPIMSSSVMSTTFGAPSESSRFLS